MLATGALAGLVNGVCVGVLRMPAFMVTLTIGMFAGGLAVLLVRLAANTETLFNLPQASWRSGQYRPPRGRRLRRRVSAAGVLERTRYGRMLQAVGYSPRAARVSGVPVARVTAIAYVTSGISPRSPRSCSPAASKRRRPRTAGSCCSTSSAPP